MCPVWPQRPTLRRPVWRPCPPTKLPADEADRLTALLSLAVLDTPTEERFDRHTRLAQRLFDVPIALVSLVDQDRQWFKSHKGLDASQTPREHAFCAHAILTPDRLLEINDAREDPRFQHNPLVTGDPDIRFYAGIPIRGPGNQPVGTLCLIDRQPRHLDDACGPCCATWVRWSRTSCAPCPVTRSTC